MSAMAKWFLAGALLMGPVGLSGAPATAEALRFEEKSLARIDTAFNREVAEKRIAGAVSLVALDGKIVQFSAYGFSDAAGKRAMTKDTLFRVASMTKPVVSSLVMMLVEEGLIELSDPVSKYLPELKELKVDGGEAAPANPAREPTIYDLLRHTGGFTYSFAGAASPAIRKQYATADIEQQKTDLSANDMLQRLSQIPLAYQPGTRFEYSVGVDLLGIVIERVTGKDLGTVLSERIFVPLKMKETGFSVQPADEARLAEVATGDPMKPWTEGWMRVKAEQKKGYLSGGGGLVSTAADYLRFCSMILNEGELDGVRLLSPATIRLMLSNHIQGLAGGPDPFTGPGYGFGLGFAVRLADGGSFVPGSQGDVNWSGLNGTTFTIDRRNRLVGILMAAAPSQRNHTRFMFKNLVYGALTGE